MRKVDSNMPQYAFSWDITGANDVVDTVQINSINCEVLLYLHYLGKLTFGLLPKASATKQS